MAIQGKQLVQMSDEEIRRLFDKPIGTCIYEKCGKPVMSSEAYRVVPAGVYHDDCYFEAWGDEVEKHHICVGRRGIRGINLEVATA